MNDLRDIKKEFGYYLRWINPDESHGLWLFLENTKDTDDKIYIVKAGEILIPEAYDFIKSKTFPRFRESGANDNYIKLFEIMGINRLYTLDDILTRKGFSITSLSNETGIPRTTISDLVKGKVDFKTTKLENALLIAKAFEMTVDELYRKLTRERIVKLSSDECAKASALLISKNSDLLKPFDYDVSGSVYDHMSNNDRIELIEKTIQDYTSDEQLVLNKYKKYLKSLL